MKKLMVLGGGISGIAAAYGARDLQIDATVYEASSRAGGLLDNIKYQGFTFDTAIHLSFASEKEVRDVFDQTEYQTHYAKPICIDGNVKLKHPAQNNTFPLAIDERVDLIKSFIERPDKNVENYGDWLDYQYGNKMSERWPRRYTRKYWSVEAEELSTTWIGNRMRRADAQEILKGGMTDDTDNTYYLSEVRYPLKGGYRSFLNPMLNTVNLELEHRATFVNPDDKSVDFKDKPSQNYDYLVSTLPLPELIKMMDNVPEDVKHSASQLYSTDINLFSVGFNKPDIPQDLFYYIYDEDILTARVYSPSIKAPSNAPEGCSSMQFEIYSSHKHPRKESIEEMKQNVLDTIYKITDAKAEDVIFVKHRYVKYANVVFENNMEHHRDIVRSWLEKKGIITAGRFGEWGYLWSNQSMMSGLNAAKLISEMLKKI